MVETSAVLDLTEALLDRGAVPKPRFQPDQVAVVGMDVRDDEADAPEVVGGTTKGQGELVGRDRPAASGWRVGAELFDADLDPADARVGPVGPARWGVVTGCDLRAVRPTGVTPVAVRDGRQCPPGGGVPFRGDREVTHPRSTAAWARLASK